MRTQHHSKAILQFHVILQIVIVAAPAPEMQAPDKQVEKGLKPRRQVHDPVRRGTVNWATDGYFLNFSQAHSISYQFPSLPFRTIGKVE